MFTGRKTREDAWGILWLSQPSSGPPTGSRGPEEQVDFKTIGTRSPQVEGRGVSEAKEGGPALKRHVKDGQSIHRISLSIRKEDILTQATT